MQEGTRQKMPEIIRLDSGEQFAAQAEKWKSCKSLALDTEFERRTTYFAYLALVQVYDGEAIYLIDPLQLECPRAFAEVLADPSIEKILHSCKEDLEVFYTAWQCQLSGLFDTQVAYQFLEGDVSIGYAKLVETKLGHQIDKQQTCSDWLKRPLSDEQIQYAAIDVLYLHEIATKLKVQLVEKGVHSLFQQECDEISSNAILRLSRPADYREAKEVWRLDSRQLALFKQLFQWRESVAREQNRTRNHLIKDQSMVAMCQKQATSYQALKQIPDIHPRSLRLYAKQWIDMIEKWQQATDQSSELKPVLNPRDVKGLKSLSDKLEQSIKSVAKTNGLHPTLLLSKRLIRKLAFQMLTTGDWQSSIKGWRRQLLFEKLSAVFDDFKQNRISPSLSKEQ